MKSTCLICEVEFKDGSDEIPYFDNNPVGVCPTCRRHAEIGRRVEGMAVAGLPQSEIEAARQDGWNKALAVAKGEKP